MSDDGEFHVVINHEEQYAIWPVGLDVPAGWRAVGPAGPKERCLASIDATWTDLRPLSLRRHVHEER
ncbi:MbtH family protein [Nonomuraea sp. NPDC050783]|uniref:MbtH family protein n=1 Tax=Nonomuraea sp. NPDC050783 TaxID=3154634 RepID=UPI003465A4E7